MQMNAVIEAVNLSIEYKLGSEWVNALRDVTLAIQDQTYAALQGQKDPKAAFTELQSKLQSLTQ